MLLQPTFCEFIECLIMTIYTYQIINHNFLGGGQWCFDNIKFIYWITIHLALTKQYHF